MRRADQASPDTTRSRAATFLLLLLVNLATLAPCLAPSALYLPQLVTYAPHAGVVYLMAAACASTYLALGVIRTAHWLTSPSRRLVPYVSTLAIGLAVALMGASAFYGKFGAYPGAAIANDFVTDPLAFVAYGRSGASSSDVAAFAIAAVVAIAAGATATRRVWREPAVAHRAIWNILAGSALLWTLRDSPTLTGSARFLITEHSLPAAKYAYALLTPFDSNRVEAIREYIPRPSDPATTHTIPKARHVLLVVADCLRADRLPSNGYERNTTPFIQSEGSRWVAFERAYAHGPASADNMPVLFNSRYFAAIDGSREGSTAVWRSLRTQAVGTAFLSAGAMEWGGITRALDLDEVEFQLYASTAEGAPTWKTTERPFDYAVDDDVPLRRYVGLLGRELHGRSSFATLYFVGSHYPFRYEDESDVFLPSLRRPTPSQEHEAPHIDQNAAIRRISNSYDNGILHIDGMVRRSVGALERLGLADDSVVIVTSDHGESLGEHQTLFHGTTLYDEQVHVPLLIRVGAHLGGIRTLLESRRSEVVGQIDLMPTILHMLSGTAPAIQSFEGASLLAGSRKPYELLLYRGTGEKVAVVTRDRKYIFDVPGRIAEEYAVTDDAGERRNLWNGSERNVAQFTAALVKRGVLPARGLQ